MNNIKTLVLILLGFLYYHTTKILCFHFFYKYCFIFILFHMTKISFLAAILSIFISCLQYNLWILCGEDTCPVLLGVSPLHLTSVFIFSLLSSRYFLMFWKGELVSWSRASLVCDHFLYPHDCTLWFWGDIVGRN